MNTIENNPFAAACIEMNTIDELETALANEPDEADMEIWNITAEQWRAQIELAINYMNEKYQTYEIYVYNDKDITGNGVYAGKKAGEVPGWDIKFIRTNKDIKTYPFFDCIILKNDAPDSKCELF